MILVTNINDFAFLMLPINDTKATQADNDKITTYYSPALKKLSIFAPLTL